MKAYRVNVYSIDHFHKVGDLSLIGEIIVGKRIIGVEEILTGYHIRIISKNNYKNINFKVYNEYGCVLGIKKEDLCKEKQVTDEELNNYIETFNNSNIQKVFTKMKVFPLENFRRLKCKVK